VLTCDPEVGQDLTRLFNQLSGYAPKARFNRLLVAPRAMRTGLVERIQRETANHLSGKPAWIRIKVNSIVDEATIDALYRASQAGVPVDLVVRGICAVRAGVPGLSETIRVRSILGRFLEHARIYAFANDGAPEVMIGSADLMHRNLDRRMEVLLSVGPDHAAELLELLDLSVDDRTASWWLQPDGTWRRHLRDAHGHRLRDLQETLITRHQRRRPARDR
jgi:polyphosphate kinase